MDQALVVLQIVAPVFILAFIGFVWVKLDFEYDIQFVTRLAMTVSVPMLIFVSLMNAEIEPTALKNLFWASIVTYLALFLVLWVVVRLLGLSHQVFWAPMIFSNTGNLGLPLALFAFGEIGLNYAIIVFAVMNIFSFTVGVWLVSGGGSLSKLFKEPIMWGTVIGAVFLIQGWHTPQWMTNTFELIGQLAIPLMLITLGVALARITPAAVPRSIALSFIKLLVCTAIAWSAGVYFDLDKVAFGVLVVQIATPVAVTSYLLAQRYNAGPEDVAGLVITSTLMSVIYLPILLAVLL